MTERLPPVVDIRITGRCNMRCLACFGTAREVADCDIDELLGTIVRLPEYGVTSISVSGGEPLVVERLVEVLSTAKSLGLSIALSTNGLLLQQKLDSVSQHLDYIGLPLDGDSPQTDGIMRGGDTSHFGAVLAAIRAVMENHPALRLKIGTVVSKLNLDTLYGIGQILSRPLYRSNVWKLYQVVCDEPNRLMLSDIAFADAVGKAKRLVDDTGGAAKIPENYSRGPIIDWRPPTLGERIAAFGASLVERATAAAEEAIRSGNVEPAPINAFVEEVAVPVLNFYGAGISSAASNADVGYTMLLLSDQGWGATALDVLTRGHPGITLLSPFGGASLVVINVDQVRGSLPLVESHEEIHVMQQEVLGGISFIGLYILANILYGYDANPFEVKAEELSSTTSTTGQSPTSTPAYDYDPCWDY